MKKIIPCAFCALLAATGSVHSADFKEDGGIMGPMPRSAFDPIESPIPDPQIREEEHRERLANQNPGLFYYDVNFQKEDLFESRSHQPLIRRKSGDDGFQPWHGDPAAIDPPLRSDMVLKH